MIGNIIAALIITALVFAVFAQAYENLRITAEAEAEEKAAAKLRAERRKAAAYKQAYETMRYNTRYEVTTRGDWTCYEGWAND